MLTAFQQMGHHVHFVFIAREKVDAVSMQAMSAQWDSFYAVPYDRSKEKPPHAGGYGIDDWFPPHVASMVETLSQMVKVDVVLVEYVFFSKALDFFPDTVVKLIDTHDVFSNRHQRLADLGLPPSFFSTAPAQEAAGLRRAHMILAIQDEEREQLASLTERPVITVGHIGPEVVLQRSPATSLRIGYLGSSNPINVASIKALLAELAPLVTDGQPFELVIAGGVCDYIDPVPSGLTVTKLGRVSELQEFYGVVDVVINPAIGGTGLKIKTVEALLHGCPVISTTDGSVGLPITDPMHFCGNVRDVANCILEVSRDAAAFAALMDESRSVFSRYQRIVAHQMACFSSKRSLAATERSLRVIKFRPTVTLVTDVRFWHRSLGKESRIYSVVESLSEGCDIHIFLLGSLWKQEVQVIEAMNLPIKVHSFKDYLPSSTRKAPFDGRFTPFEKKRFSNDFFSSFEEFCRVRPANAVVIEYVMLSYLRHVQHCPPIKCLDTHDVMSLRSENFSHFQKKHFIELPMEEELRIFEGFELSVAIQRQEYRFLSGVLGAHRTVYVPHEVPVTYSRLPTSHVRQIVFVGGDSPMNVDGMTWFLEQVWPLFRNTGAKMTVAGTVCDALKSYEGDDIVLLGRVPDLTEVYAGADIAINPCFYGGGLKIKTVEYLSHGLPAVLTSEATRGVPIPHEEAFLLARTRDEFISHLARLFVDGELRARLSRNAHMLARREYGAVWGSQFCKTLKSLAAAMIH